MVYDDFITYFLQDEAAVRVLLNTLIREKIEDVAAEVEGPSTDQLADLEKIVLEALELDEIADQAYRDLTYIAGQIEIRVQDAAFRAGLDFGASLASLSLYARRIEEGEAGEPDWAAAPAWHTEKRWRVRKYEAGKRIFEEQAVSLTDVIHVYPELRSLLVAADPERYFQVTWQVDDVQISVADLGSDPARPDA